MDLEVIIGWHAFAYLCNMLGCFGNALQIEMNIGDYHGMDIEPKGDGALNIHDDTHVIKYLQVGEVLIKHQHPMNGIVLCIRSSSSSGKVIPSYVCEQMDECLE